MKRITILLTVLLLGAGGTLDAEKKELDKLQGTWTAVKLIVSGKDLLEGGATFALTLKGNMMKVKGPEDVEKEYSGLKLKLDPSTTPKCVDATVTAGSQKDTTLEGIYEVKGDEVTFCVRILGQNRPTKFEAPEGSGLVVAVFKREKK